MSDLSKIEEEIYTHEYMWRSATKLIEHAEAQEEGQFYFLLPALLLSFTAYEAFVNFCGYIVCPELWREEKKNFQGKGIEGKLEVIIGALPDFSWEKGGPPYQRVKKLEKFRDFVSHGKVIATNYVTERKDDGSHFRFEHPWDTYLKIHEVKSSKSDIKIFCQSLLVEIRKYSDHPHLIYDAFEGALASGTGTS